MLFGYPADAPNENDIHDWIVAYFDAGVDALNAGGTPPAFKTFMPATPPELKWKTNLKRAFNRLWEILAQQTSVDREAVRAAVKSQANLPDILRNNPGCAGPIAIPEEARQVIGDIFHAGFELLTATGVRDRVWDKVRAPNGDSRFCAFCGYEQFETSPSAKRPDFDHYLASSLYEAARANLKNLAPMGRECNGNFKKANNVIFDDAGARRPAFYPYEPRQTSISLAGSRLVPGPEWRIGLGGEAEADTWDAVFKVRERYEHLILSGTNQWWRSLAKLVALESVSFTPNEVYAALEKRGCAMCNAERPAERQLQLEQLKLILATLTAGGTDAQLLCGILADLR